MEFISRNRVGVAAILLLMVSLLLVSVGARARQRVDPLTAVALEVIRPLQGALSLGLDGMTHAWGSYVALVSVNQENERLNRRILELEQQVVRMAEVEQTDKRLADLLQFRSTVEGDLLGARIIGRDPQPWFSTLIINKGEADGVRKNMAVLSPYGVVGQTISTSSHAARVMLITDHNSGVDALVQRTRARGIVEGALDGRCMMKYLKRGEDVEVEDRIVTSGLDGIFPKGILVGTVTHVTRGNRGLLQLAEVKPSVPVDQIEEVLVVRSTAHPVP